MLIIQPITQLDGGLLRRLITGYTTDAVYRASRTETDALTVFELRLTPLAQPYTKEYGALLDDEAQRRYAALAAAGHAFGAFDGSACVGIAVTEPQPWNGSLNVWEFHITPASRGQGIGRRLMNAVLARARELALRTVVCETQTTNVPAIRFYRALGFTLDGLDLSLYANDAYPNGEMAVWLKQAVE